MPYLQKSRGCADGSYHEIRHVIRTNSYRLEDVISEEDLTSEKVISGGGGA